MPDDALIDVEDVVKNFMVTVAFAGIGAAMAQSGASLLAVIVFTVGINLAVVVALVVVNAVRRWLLRDTPTDEGGEPS